MSWDGYVYAHAHLGPPGRVRCYDVYAPDAESLAVTAHVCALASNHPPGTKFVIGRKWAERIDGNAKFIEDHLD